ncbi:hypothetical protein BC835DRAFT_1413137 [Cytidiella melzeri]|nr:hypothetical protein BC835DRAFT_1413137 [Cytidiella melzeri]
MAEPSINRFEATKLDNSTVPLPTASTSAANASSSSSSSPEGVLQRQPLPDYTTSWGPHLHRPSKFPDNYDTRIDPAHIFVFTVHPITGIERDFYVTPKPCDYCAKVRQLCSRTRPQCSRCGSRDNGRVCVFEEGWVRLPGPKCMKVKRKSEGGEGGALKKPKKPRTSATKSKDMSAEGKLSVTGSPTVDPVASIVKSFESEETHALEEQHPAAETTQTITEVNLTVPAASSGGPALPSVRLAEARPPANRESSRYALRRQPKRTVKVS